MHFRQWKRRQFITLLGGAAVAWPLAVRAQQPAMPVIGFLSSRSPSESASVEAAFREGLKEAGYIEGQNLHIAFRWADGQFARLLPLAEALVDLRVAVIVTVGGVNAAFAAKSATATIPIVFVVGVDPVANGLVTSLNRPAGNITGMTVMSAELILKRLELLHEIAPKAAAVAMLANPLSPESTSEIKDVQTAAQTMGLQLKIYNASTLNELNTAFAAIAEQRPRHTYCGHRSFFPAPAGGTDCVGCAHRRSGDLSISRVRTGWRTYQLRNEHSKQLSTGRNLHRANSQGREACRTADHAANAVSDGHQPQDGQDTRT
jgi:putative tryptophan/tyrosine transport system substrate-binding protein